MKQLLLVDDENITRNGIKKIIQNAQLSLNITEADDGEEALKIALETEPDILLTDIKMPKMDGITLAKKIRDIYPECVIVFLTNYSEKTYLIDAIKLHAEDFIEKPIEIEELLGILSKAMNISERKQKDEHKNQDSAKNMLLILWAKQLDKEQSDIADFFRLATLYGVTDIFRWSYRCIISRSIMEFVLSSEAEAFLKMKHCTLIYYPLDYYSGCNYYVYYICTYTDSFFRDDDIKKFLQKFKNQEDIVFGIGNEAENYKTAYQSYYDALCAVNSYFYVEKNIIFYSSISSSKSTDTGYIERIINDINYSDFFDIQRNIPQIYNYLRIRTKIPVTEARNYYRIIVDKIIFASSDFFSNLFGEHVNEKLKEKINHTTTLRDMNQVLTNFVNNMIIGNPSEKQISSIIYSFIKNNLHDSQLDLKLISEHTGYSISYICPIFKRFIGLTINQYITEVRLEKSLELLVGSKDTLDEISEKVGYNSSKYFIKVLKKKYGMTPNEYRIKIL